MTHVISAFRGDHLYLSNFFKCAVPMPEDLNFSSAEQAYQYAKAPDDEWRERIYQADTPGLAKRLGRQCPIRPDWEQIKDAVMLSVVTSKFVSNAELAKRLLDTTPAVLIEGNYWHDTYWGICLCPDCGCGSNRLGTTLMTVRAMLLQVVGVDLKRYRKGGGLCRITLS